MRLIRGENEHVMCVWAPGAMRSLREARSLLVSGCADSELELAPFARPFLDMLSPQHRSLFDIQSAGGGRLVFGARAPHERDLLDEVGEFAVHTGLSLFRPPNVVQVRLLACDQVGFWRALSVLGEERGAVLEVVSPTGVYRIVHVLGAYEIFAKSCARSHGARLQLLGFRHSQRGSGPLARRILARGMRSIPKLLSILGGDELAELDCFDLRLIARSAGEKLRLVRS